MEWVNILTLRSRKGKHAGKLVHPGLFLQGLAVNAKGVIHIVMIMGFLLGMGSVLSCTSKVQPRETRKVVVTTPANQEPAGREPTRREPAKSEEPVSAGNQTAKEPSACEKKPSSGFVLLDDEEKRAILAKLDLRRQHLGSWKYLRPALLQTRNYLACRPSYAPALCAGAFSCTYGDLLATVDKLLACLPRLDKHPEYLVRKFHWYRLSPETLVTGYYEPVIQASPVPCPEYPFPLYGVPRDLKVADLGSFHHRWAGQHLIYRIEDGKICPYHDREAIDSDGVLNDQGVEIAWVRNLVDIFFLQIQGSGRLVFPDGSVRHICYAGKNGRKYVSLGKVLIERGYMSREEMSMQGIKAFLKTRPDMVEQLLNTNPSYVFFRLEDKGPYGAMGKILTPMVSMASDPRRIPLGSVLVSQMHLPEGKKNARQTSLVGLAQDKGGAIRGNRLDLFCGAGKRAAFLAGHMQERATVCLLLAEDGVAH